MPEWPVERLGDVVHMDRRRVLPTELADEVVHYSIPALDECGGPKIEPSESIKSQKFAVESDACLLSLLNPRILRTVIARGGPRAVASTEFAILRPKDSQRLLLPYLALVVQSDEFLSSLRLLVAGTTGSRQRVKHGRVLELPIPVPPLVVQRRIVDLISHVEASAAAAQDAAKHASATYGELLRTAFATGDVKTLGDIAEFINGYPFKPTELDGKGLPVIRIKQLLNPDEVPDRSSADIPSSRHLQDGDLVFTWSGTLAVRSWDRGPALLNQHLFRVLEVEGIERKWLRFALDASIEALNEQTHGSTMKHITKKKLLVHPVNVPDAEEQREVADMVESVLVTLERAQQAGRALSAARSQMLSSLLLGDHDVPESYDRFLEGQGAA